MIEPKIQTRIIFTGDIAFSHYYQDGWQGKGCLDNEIENYMNASDYVVANVESPLTERTIISKRTLNHSSNPSAGSYLASRNMKVWNLANNHIMDCGADGLKDTLETAKENGCRTVGAGMSLSDALKPIILGDTIKVGILSVASATWEYLKADSNLPGAITWDKKKQLQITIGNLRKEVDWVVLVAHGGDEYCDIALPYIRKKYHALLNWGVDVIIGHHPHVVQNYEVVGDKIIFYSLGNFIFDTDNQRKFLHTDNGVMIGINFKQNAFSYDTMAVHIDRENGIIRKGKMPVVFREIEEREYEKLWPLVAKTYCHVDLYRRKRLSPRLRSANQALVIAHEVLACRHERERTIQIGRLLSFFGRWKKTSVTEICEYLHEWDDQTQGANE